MQFDFTTQFDRRGMDALALDSVGMPYPNTPRGPRPGFDVIPMWVADMNFATAPAVTNALRARLDHPIFGYFYPSDDAYGSIKDWHRVRHGVDGIESTQILFHNGLLGGLLSAVQVVASPGDAVLVHSPTYTGFTKTLENAGFRIVLSPLVLDEDGVYRMDFEDMDSKLAEHSIHAAIICSPHNPTGRVWSRDELVRAMEVYRRHDCMVISDEIWSDIIMPGHVHTPTQSVCPEARECTVALYAPSKTFNIAGIVGAYSIVYNEWIASRLAQISARSHYNEQNVLSMHALIGGYSKEGMDWVEELIQVLSDNVEFACEHIATCYPGVSCTHPEGTYMLYLDVGEWCDTHGCDLDDVLRRGWDVGVAWQDGRPFHGPSHIRMNLASPAARIAEAFDRLDRYVFVDRT